MLITMDRALVSIIVLWCYFSSGLTENAEINSKLLESYRLRRFLMGSYLHHFYPFGNHFHRPSHDETLKHYLEIFTADYIMNALQSTFTKTTTTPPSTTKANLAAHPTSSASCHDSIPTCLNYGPAICMTYPNWAKQQCAKFCVFCINTASSNSAQLKPKPTTATHGNGGAIP